MYLEFHVSLYVHLISLFNPSMFGFRVLFAEVEQRPHLLLPVPNPARTQVHSLRQCPAQGPEAFQPSPQHHLRSQGKTRKKTDIPQKTTLVLHVAKKRKKMTI